MFDIELDRAIQISLQCIINYLLQIDINTPQILKIPLCKIWIKRNRVVNDFVSKLTKEISPFYEFLVI